MAKGFLSEDQIRELQAIGITPGLSDSNVTLYEIIKAFIDESSRGDLKATTLEHYHYVMETFYRYCMDKFNGVEFKLEEVSLGFMKGYYDWLTQSKPCIKGNLTHLLYGNNPMTPEEIAKKFPDKVQRGLSIASADGHFRTLKKFWKWIAEERGLVSQSPLKKYKTKKPYITEREIISGEEYSLLLSACDSRTFLGLRDFVVLNILWETGMRAGETSKLKVSDVSIDSRIITLRRSITKTEVQAIVPLVPALAKLLEKWIDIAELTPADPLIPGRTKNAPLSRNAVYHLICRLYKRAGIQRNIHPHLFRYTFITRVTNNTENHLVAQKLAIHDDVKTTSLYYRPTSRDMQKAREAIDERFREGRKVPTRSKKKRLF